MSLTFESSPRSRAMKLYLLLTLAFVAVQMSSAVVLQADDSREDDRSDPDPLHCADCVDWDPNLAQLDGVQWLCMRSLPPMRCPIRNYPYCKTYCHGAAKVAPIKMETEGIEI